MEERLDRLITLLEELIKIIKVDKDPTKWKAYILECMSCKGAIEERIETEILKRLNKD